jgi:hypothetical protein
LTKRPDCGTVSGALVADHRHLWSSRGRILLRDDHGGHLESASTFSADRSKGGGPPGPNGATSAVTMGLLVRGKVNSAADVLTTEHDTSPAEDDVT